MNSRFVFNSFVKYAMTFGYKGRLAGSVLRTYANASLSSNPVTPAILVRFATNSVPVPVTCAPVTAAKQCAVIGSRLR